MGSRIVLHAILIVQSVLLVQAIVHNVKVQESVLLLVAVRLIHFQTLRTNFAQAVPSIA
jgi:hypothetical protein